MVLKKKDLTYTKKKIDVLDQIKNNQINLLFWEGGETFNLLVFHELFDVSMKVYMPETTTSQLNTHNVPADVNNLIKHHLHEWKQMSDTYL